MRTATVSWTPSGGRQRRCSFTAHCDIGRAPTNRIILAEPGISRHHARLQLSPAGLMLHNRSRSGSILIGERLLPPGEHVALKQSDTFRIGSHELTVLHLHCPLTQLRCSNTDCGKQVSAEHTDCPWCGTSLAFAVTEPGGSL